EPFIKGPLEPLGRVVPQPVRACESCRQVSSRAPPNMALVRSAALRFAPANRELLSTHIAKSVPEKLASAKLQPLKDARRKVPRERSARWNFDESKRAPLKSPSRAHAPRKSAPAPRALLNRQL